MSNFTEEDQAYIYEFLAETADMQPEPAREGFIKLTEEMADYQAQQAYEEYIRNSYVPPYWEWPYILYLRVGDLYFFIHPHYRCDSSSY